MNQLQELLASSNEWQSKQAQARKLASKWEKTGLLESLDTISQGNMAIMLEEQAKRLLVEGQYNLTSLGSATGAGFTTGQGENWASVALPMVRKIFGQIAAKEFVSVQPMNVPSGLVFFLDFKYSDNKTPFTDGQSLYGRTNPNSRFPFATTDTVDGLYNAGRFSYSTNLFSSSLAAASASLSTPSFADVNFNALYAATGTLTKVTIATGAGDSEYNNWLDPDAVRAFIITSPSYSAPQVLQEFTKRNETTGALTFILSVSSTVKPTDIYYTKKTADYRRGDFEADRTNTSVPNSASATNIVIPEINIDLRSDSINAKTKKLKATWSPEFGQDVMAYQNVDAEAELTNIVSEYISMEIDLEILEMLIQDAAAGTEYWSAKNNEIYDAGTNSFVTNPSLYFNTQGGWFATLGTKMQKLSNRIHQLTMRGGANFVVTSPSVATILESIPGFASTSNGDAAQMEYAFGVQKMGQINNRYTIYKNPYMTENLMLLGYRGSQFLEAGAVYAPYIPLMMTPLIYDPETMVPRKGLMTRYAKKMMRPEYYAKIYVAGLDTI